MGTDREEVLARVQRGFEYQYNAYGKIKKEDIASLDYNTMQAWKRLQKHIKIRRLKRLFSKEIKSTITILGNIRR